MAMDFFIEANEIEEINIFRNPKVYLPRKNPFEIYDDNSFKKIYRMRKQVAQFIIDLVKHEITQENEPNYGGRVDANIQVLATIRYLGKGAYGQDTADLHGLSQPTVSNIIKRVVTAIASHRDEFIKLPQENEIEEVKREFYKIAKCPSILGAIDCTHIKIKNPGGDEGVRYINRKGFHSLNVQVVSDAKCRVRDIVARWRGSVHDARIWNESLLKRRCEDGEINGILFGDNGYPCSRYVLTPVLNPLTEAERRYNAAHIKTRNVVERLFGYLKNKFRVCFNGFNLNVDVTKAAIVAIAILHNICVNDRLENDSSDDDDDEQVEDGAFERIPEDVHANVFRLHYIQRYFR